MLILSRKASECIHLGDDIVLTIVAVGNDKVRIGVQAPPGVKILRTELELDATLPMTTLPMTTPAERAAQTAGKNAAQKAGQVAGPLAGLVKQIRRAA